MGKIREILESQVSFISEEDYEWITTAMKIYAEWYSGQCLEEADKIYSLDLDKGWRGDGLPSDIEMPKHDE